MKPYRFIITLTTLAMLASFSFICPLPGTLLSKSYAKEVPNQSKIIADTLAAHNIVCLSKNGTIEKILLDGNWIDVHEVELVHRTLILRTARGSFSLAAVLDSP